MLCGHHEMKGSKSSFHSIQGLHYPLHMRLIWNRAFLSLLGCCWPIWGHHGQHIELAPGTNYVTIVVHYENNRLVELLPGAPVGTVAFKFDNVRGYQSSQLYSNGWSSPGMTLHPSETAIMMPPINQKYVGQIEGERAYPLPEVYRGWNLLPIQAFFPLPPLTQKITPNAEDEIWAPTSSGFSRGIYNGEERRWIGLQMPRDGMWYYAKDWPVNSAGEFFELRGAIYFNNFAPAFGLDEPFLDANGCALNGSATLLNQTGDTSWEPLGEAVPVVDGYIDRTRDLMRYVKMDDELASLTLAISLQALGGTQQSQPFAVRPGKGLSPVGLSGFQWARRPRFIKNPVSQIVSPGHSVELEATYNYPGGGGGTDSLIEAEECGGGAENYCSVRYQWQRLTPSGNWQNVTEATSPKLRFASVAEGQYGSFRLRAAWGCREDVSAAASILRPVLLNLETGLLPKTLELYTTAAGTKRVEIQFSEDLLNWRTYVAVEQPTNVWNVLIPNIAPRIFLRALTEP